MQAARLANEAVRVEAPRASNDIKKAPSEPKDPGSSGRTHDDETITRGSLYCLVDLCHL